MKNWSMRIFTLFGMLLLSGAAFADTSISSSAVTNHTDLSISYLAQIFGTVGNSLQGTSGQMLGMLFYKFNQGILVVAGFWLSYLVFTTFIKSAHEGSFMSPNRNIVIILLRVALGFGLLLPNPVTGYSVFQDILMKVVVSGVSLADETWSYGLRYLNNGGQVWRDPTTASGGNTVLSLSQVQKIVGENTAGPNNPNLGPAQKIFLNEVCMYSSAGLSASVVQGQNSFGFPDGSNSKGSGCGSLIVPGSGISQGFAQQGASAMVYDLLPAAKAFVCQLNPTTDGCSGSTTSNVASDIGNAFFNAALGYANAVMPATTTQSPDQLSRAFIQQAETGGWMLAGRYYWDLARVSSNYNQSADITSYLPNVILTPQMPRPGDASSETQKLLSSGLNAVGSYANATSILVSQYSGAASAGASGGANGKQPGFGDADTMTDMPLAVAQLLLPYEDGLNGIENDFVATGIDPAHPYQNSSGYSYDPIVFLHNLGMRCLSLAGAIWIATSVIIMAMSAATIFCQAMVNANTIFQAVVSWMKPFLMMMAVVFLGVGITLGYYVPLYPYLLFTFGVIGWLIRVLVGMVAAPLVCLGMTHPEGHDFLGIAQQLFQLLLSIFIEPALMIIGLFAGMILSYVSLRILVYTFSGFISDLFGTPDPSGGIHSILTSAVAAQGNFAAQNMGGPSLVYLTLPILLIIFAAIVYTVTNKCFSVIHELPGAVMEWIGAPRIQSAAGQMADSVAGVVSQAGQSLGRGLTADGHLGALRNKKGEQVFVKDEIQKKQSQDIPVR